MIDFDDVIKENIKKTKSTLARNSLLAMQYEYQYETNSLFNLISQQPDIAKIYFYANDHYESNINF